MARRRVLPRSRSTWELFEVIDQLLRVWVLYLRIKYAEQVCRYAFLICFSVFFSVFVKLKYAWRAINWRRESRKESGLWYSATFVLCRRAGPLAVSFKFFLTVRDSPGFSPSYILAARHEFYKSTSASYGVGNGNQLSLRWNRIFGYTDTFLFQEVCRLSEFSLKTIN